MGRDGIDGDENEMRDCIAHTHVPRYCLCATQSAATTKEGDRY